MRTVTRKTSLAMRALRALPGDGCRMSRADLASAITSTMPYVPQIVAPLLRAGWMRSSTGPHGGYTLTDAGRIVTVLEIMQAVEGWDEHRCLLAHTDEDQRCGLHEPWQEACDSFDALLAHLPVRHGLDPPLGAAASSPAPSAPQRGSAP